MDSAEEVPVAEDPPTESETPEPETAGAKTATAATGGASAVWGDAQSSPPPAQASRAGRNLPAAIGVGAVLGGLAVLTLLTVKATFLLYMGAVLVVALTELTGAFAKRDIRIPVFEEPSDAIGEHAVDVKIGSRLLRHTLSAHPFDVVGWDGTLYPYALNMQSFAPMLGIASAQHETQYSRLFRS